MEAERDQQLVDRAKLGDTEAFGELIEHYRDKARGWAERMTGDAYLADDVVQDALIRAFLHLGSLADTSRFRPWLHRIVRNQANMRLRRGGIHRREQPFASIRTAPGDDHTQVDWDDLDNMLYHLSRTAGEAAAAMHDPEEQLMRKELYESIHALLHCLSRKEQGIFKAYFFRQLSPDEIAAMFRMTTGSVYTYIHRSRQKLRQENIRLSLGLIPEKKEVRGPMRSRMLVLPESLGHTPMKMTLIEAVWTMLAMSGDRKDESEVMGLSTVAFRMKLSDKTTFADGIYMFDWRAMLQQVMHELQYEVTLLCGQLADSPVPLLGAVERFPVVLRMEEAVLPFIRAQLDIARPVLYFDTQPSRPYVHEWAVIYGYDDHERVVYVTDPVKPDGKRISYDDVVNNPVRFLAGISPRQVPAKTASERRRLALDQARRAIRFAVDYAKRGCDYIPGTSYLTYSSGLAAYDRWIRHLRNPDISPNRYGMSQLAAVYADTKRYAAQYLRTLSLEGEEMRLVLLASEAYEQAADALEELSGQVPFIRSSEVLSEHLREACAEQLERAKTFEGAAIAYLETSMAENQRKRMSNHD
jgi:RNA polymerase sigma factor (sigma-70 family)